MELYTNFFELHVGFPDDVADGEPALVDSFLDVMQRTNSPDWSRSTVRSMYPSGATCALDPHNVPGTLGWLVSRKIFQAERSWEVTQEKLVLPACDHALEQLARLGARDARLEIEFPFACLASSSNDGRLSRSTWVVDPVSIEESRLRFPFGTVDERVDPVPIAERRLSFVCGTLLEHVPRWEIHFLLERIGGAQTGGQLGVNEVGDFLSRYELNIEQTIEYRSAAMEASGRDDFRLIATAYFPTVEKTEGEAKRVFYKTSLCQDAMARGYNVRLILEHIISCVQPKLFNPEGLNTASPVEADCLR
jgi:hypothetical protein